TTLGGLIWWFNIKQDEYFIMQEHKVGLPVWPYKYRILIRENRMEIANSNDHEEILMDWRYLEKHAIPQIEDKIDIAKTIGETIQNIDASEIITSVIEPVIKSFL
ncbi:hypothetical protein, partial [Leptodesmis sp.]|uniref:hypothetical protein n=1 Tax=Leptodesmis sp. TaxID=3100501 RepID=UPI0040535501